MIDLVLKVLLFAAAGCALLVLNLWFFRLATQSFLQAELPETIAPIRLVGAEDKDSRLGQALAGMLLARLSKIRQEMAVSADQLREPTNGTNTPRPQDFSDTPTLSLPARIFEPIDLSMKLGGFEVGGFLNWAHRALVRYDSLELAVENTNGRAIATGVWNQGRDAIWVEIEGDKTKPIPNDQIASAVAYALTQKHIINRIPAIGALTPSEFESLLKTLTDAATLQRQVALGRVAEVDFARLFDQLESLIKKTPRWSELLQLTAKLADSGGKTEKALEFYKKLLELPNRTEWQKTEIEERIAKLSERLVVVKAKPIPPDPQTGTSEPLTKWPVSALGIASLDMSRSPRIAVLGGIPASGTLDETQFQVVRGDANYQPDETMGEYLRTVVQAVQLVAPKAKFVFTPSGARGGGMSDSQLLAELQALSGAKPDILLVTLGPLNKAVYGALIESFATQGILVIIPAGNDAEKSVPFEGDPIAEKILIVAAIGPTGRPTKFTQQGKDVVWAPGENIPLRPTGKQISLRSGTTYSAALAAGVAARLLAEHPKIPAQKLIDTLRHTTKPQHPSGPPVLQLTTALQKLSGG